MGKISMICFRTPFPDSKMLRAALFASAPIPTYNPWDCRTQGAVFETYIVITSQPAILTSISYISEIEHELIPVKIKWIIIKTKQKTKEVKKKTKRKTKNKNKLITKQRNKHPNRQTKTQHLFVKDSGL